MQAFRKSYLYATLRKVSKGSPTRGIGRSRTSEETSFCLPTTTYGSRLAGLLPIGMHSDRFQTPITLADAFCRTGVNAKPRWLGDEPLSLIDGALFGSIMVSRPDCSKRMSRRPLARVSPLGGGSSKSSGPFASIWVQEEQDLGAAKKLSSCCGRKCRGKGRLCRRSAMFSCL